VSLINYYKTKAILVMDQDLPAMIFNF